MQPKRPKRQRMLTAWSKIVAAGEEKVWFDLSYSRERNLDYKKQRRGKLVAFPSRCKNT